MATEADVTCPVCQGTTKEPSVVIPCRHHFCLGCIMRWAEKNATCPLCRQKITAIRYSIWSEDDYMEVRAESEEDSEQDEQEAAEPVPQPAVSGLPPEEWAALFREYPAILGPLRPWARQQASELFGADWWEQDVLEANVIACLCRCGLNELVLVRELQPLLQGQTVSFVQQLIHETVEMCSDDFLEELGLLEPAPAIQQQNGPVVDIEGSQDSREPEDSPEATPSPAASPRATPVIIELSSSSPESSDTEELPSTSSAALRGDPGHPATAPDLTEQEEPCSEPGLPAQEDAAVPGCSHGPSPPGQGRDRSSGRPRRAPKRRANSSPDSPQPCKRPPPRRR
ncbi:uncharacterized protein [Anas platyrhynchos]|uniref:uncharacterized protein n=1 Tax=Anas platyrhynchos TaxID=8839 RepID=UPI003AF2DE7A